MPNAKLIVPKAHSHWSLRIVDTQKPFPRHVLANVTYKVLRFLYPPFALEVVDLTHVVSSPELNAYNVGNFLSLSLILSCVAYALWNLFRKARTPGRKSTHPLLEKQVRFKSEAEFAGNLDLPINASHLLLEPEWMSKSNVSLVDAGFGNKHKENDDRYRTKIDKDRDNQDDLSEKIDRAVCERPVSRKQQRP